MKKGGEKCAYCGIGNHETDDHVPPKSIFIKPRPSNLVTVPSCDACNSSFQDNDDLFALFISTQAGMDGELQRELHEKVKRAVARHRHFREILESASPEIPIMDTDGSILDKVQFLKMNDFHVSSTLERIVTGLAFHHYRFRVKSTGYVSIWYPSDSTMKHAAIQDVLKDCVYSHIGHNHEFAYRHGRTIDNTYASFWEFLFYDKFHFTAMTTPLVP